MKTLLIRIIFSLFFSVFLFFLFSAYQYYKALHSDDPVSPGVYVEKGLTTVVRGDLAIDMSAGESYTLEENDIIITKEATLAIVTWPDRSITRLGSQSRMHISRMIVALDYSTIQIEFALEQGQVWSTVVRTLYPGSYFRARLPGQGVIAGVRGTVFDIDISRGYIRSLDHSVTLTDTIGNVVYLLPGELVSVKNILQKLTQNAVDQTWNQLNNIQDTLFLESRRLEMTQHIDLLSGKTGGIFDSFVRWVLSFIPSFEDIVVLESLLSDVPGLEKIQIPREQLLGLYQKFQDTKFVQERDKIRTYIIDQGKDIGLDKEYIQTFARGAVWDSIMLSGGTLEGAKEIINTYTRGIDVQMSSLLRAVPLQDIDTKTRDVLRQLLK